MHIYETFIYTRWTRSDFFVKQRLFYKVDGDFDTIGLMVTLCVAFLKVLQKSIRVQLDKAPGVWKKIAEGHVLSYSIVYMSIGLWYWWHCFEKCVVFHLNRRFKRVFLITCCPSVCKLFTFLTTSLEPLGQIQYNLVQIILMGREL